MMQTNTTSTNINTNILSIIAAALVGQGENTELAEILRTTQETAPETHPAARNNCVHTDSEQMKTFYEWLTVQTHARFRYACIPDLAERLLACPDFPRSCDLLENCEKMIQLQLTAEELQGFVIAWHSYYTYTAHLKKRHGGDFQAVA